MERLFIIGPQFNTEDLSFFQPDTNLDKFYFVDGGLDRFLETTKSKKPLQSQSIGDQDSSRFEMDIKLNPHKEESDLSVTLDLISEKVDQPEICALGFLGGRRDHEYFNLKSFANFVDSKKSFACHLSRELTVFTRDEFWHFDHHGLFSLFSFRDSHYSIQGEVIYPIENALIPSLSSQLLSNEAEGEFRVKASQAFFFYRPQL